MGKQEGFGLWAFGFRLSGFRLSGFDPLPLVRLVAVSLTPGPEAESREPEAYLLTSLMSASKFPSVSWKNVIHKS